MQPNNLTMTNVRIEQAELQAQARAERQAQRAARRNGRTNRGLFGRLRRR